jgi:ankyrin repeat protein
VDTRLIKAAFNGDDKLVAELIKEKVDLELTDKNGNTALLYLAAGRMKYYHEEIRLKYRLESRIKSLQLLVDAGANVNAQSKKSGNTALMLFSLGGENLYELFMGPYHYSFYEILFKAGADVNLLNNEGESALLITAKYCNDPAIKQLVEAGAKLDVASISNGWTPLFWTINMILVMMQQSFGN